MSYTEINVAIDLLSSLVVVVLIFAQLGKKKRTRQDKLFLLMLIAHMICTLSDAVNWAFDLRAETIFRVLTLAGNFLSYFVSALAYTPFLLYIMVTATKKRKSDAKMIRASCILSALMVLILLFNLWNGMLYTIDENNVYHWGEWDWLFNILVFAQLILPSVQILRSRKALERRQTGAFLAYEILPILAILLSLIPIELTLVYPATMISLLLLYVNVQQDQENRLTLREAELAESHAAIMVSQIQPHFLYNALSAVENLCETDPPRAQQAVADFSKYLRGNMQALTQRQPVPFSNELRHIRHYLNLEQLRFGDKLRVVMNIGPTDFLLPVLSVQPILENAVKHGVTCRKSGGTVTLRTMETPEAWSVIVQDDGVGFDPAALEAEGKEHVGLSVVNRRLISVVGGKLEIDSSPGKGTVATITIPKEEV